ncbi:Zn(II)2Cys6 transcription factor [Aspergillus thermomutatus]|uniref:Zn(2)-C6 fungal-type domain-containing protein n=1 Tax=Aspergillus thermomutatus TaxID=41047 RepID=A0A397GGS9_ASPTH|nr:uncharacterized protein CDV56_104610 [Aspergillus thermomutatus]RHZ47230.1 hypothetical protein CDV56_104610 [Aspergillus thermomutatus]
MQLKRGLPRESCDFCHRRKVKCDRSLRARQGLASCSQCTLRQGPCLLNDPTETRTRRRGRGTAHGGNTGMALGDGGSNIAEDDNPAAAPFASASQLEPLLPLEDDHSALLQYPDDMFAENFLGLSRDNIFFLNQAFMGDSGGSMEWLGQGQSAHQDSQVSTIGDGQPSNAEPQAQIRTEESQQFPWLDSVADSNTVFTAALHCYFKFAAPWLPILLEDAFWQDYHNGRSSHVLASAIACRGMPFTTVSDKWILQQRFAHDFREAFLGAQSIASNDGTIRLDDLEALALMVNFEYEDTNSPPLHSNLGKLFLRHESLVMMTLQSRIQDRISTGPDSSVTLARARERRMLLYWHVYGLDAFHCLDRKQISLIPDKDASDHDSFPQHEATDFFDAVLELAVIARKILRQLCSNSAKRRGIESNDVHDIYAQIYQWRNHTCPPHLRRHEQSPGIVATHDNNEGHSTELKRHIQLHRAVLWALEINCLMQVECFVSDFGIKDNGDLRAEMTTARVEYESLRALNDMIAICHWIDPHAICDEDGKQHSLIDLAPLALRNACAGLCFWTCQRGINSTQLSTTRAPLGRRGPPENSQKHPAHAHIENAQLLRDAAAKATSHRDTAEILERLDKQIALLKAEMDNALGAK